MNALFPRFLAAYYCKGPELDSMMEDYYKRIQKRVVQGSKYEELLAIAPVLIEDVRRAARDRCDSCPFICHEFSTIHSQAEPKCGSGFPPEEAERICCRQIGLYQIPRDMLP